MVPSASRNPCDLLHVTRNTTQRLAKAYRRARRKLYERRQLGPEAVAAYLVESHLARRLSGLEEGRPPQVASWQIEPMELHRYETAARALAGAAGGEDVARSRRRQDAQRRLYVPRMNELLARLLALGGQQVVTLGYADDTSRRVVLLPNGQEFPADGESHTPLTRLVERLFTDPHGCIITIRTAPGDTISVYEAADRRFHQEPRREVFAAAVIGQLPVYFTGADAQRNLSDDPRTMSPLPRVPGTAYCDWPHTGARTEQGERP